MIEAPTLRDEIDRKALETIEKLQNDLDNGRISQAQYAYGIDILWSAVSGLAGKDFLTIMEIMGGSKVGSEPVKELFVRWSEAGKFEESMVGVTNDLKGKVTFSLSKKGSTNTKVYDLTGEANPSRAGKEKFEELCKNLVSNGFHQITFTVS